MERICHWDDSIASRVVHNKKAVGAALFISFLGYTAAVILAEMKKDTKVRLCDIICDRYLKT